MIFFFLCTVDHRERHVLTHSFPTRLSSDLAAGLNRGEFVLGHGLHGKAGSWKQIGGEGAGEVVSVGKDVTGFKPGDKVMGRCPGAFSEYALMEAAEALAKLDSLSWEEAACRPLTFLVGWKSVGEGKSGDVRGDHGG